METFSVFYQQGDLGLPIFIFYQIYSPETH